MHKVFSLFKLLLLLLLGMLLLPHGRKSLLYSLHLCLFLGNLRRALLLALVAVNLLLPLVLFLLQEDISLYFESLLTL